jgi:hypothetical protein
VIDGPTRHATRAMGAVAVVEGSRIDEEQLARVVHDTARRISALLEWCRSRARPSTADELVAKQMVDRVVDASGAEGFVPFCRPRMLLRERLLGLVLADYLSRPSDFLSALRQDGARVRIDPPPPRSAIVLKGHDTLPWGLRDDGTEGSDED